MSQPTPLHPTRPKNEVANLARKLQLTCPPEQAVSQLRSLPQEQFTPFQARVLRASGAGLERSIVAMLAAVGEENEVAGWMHQRLEAAVKLSQRLPGHDWSQYLADFRLARQVGAALSLAVFSALTVQNEGGARVALWLLEHPRSASLSDCCRAMLQAADGCQPELRHQLLEGAREALARAAEPMEPALVIRPGSTTRQALESLADRVALKTAGRVSLRALRPVRELVPVSC